MVLRSDNDVFHARALGLKHPLLRIVFGGVELLGEFFIVGDWDLSPAHDLLAEAWNFLSVVNAGQSGIDPPMDEHSETRLAPPCHSGVALFLGFARERGGRRCRNRALDRLFLL